MSSLKEIIKDKLQNTIINELINNIYNYKIQGIEETQIDYFFVSSSKIIMTKTISTLNYNITIFLIELNCLKTKQSIIDSNLFTYCVECGKIHAQHKYKTCGHSVNYTCAYNAIKYNNKCNQCAKNIIKHKMEFAKGKKETCSICLEDTDTYISKCGHHFHKSCISKYCESHKDQVLCPMCRENIISFESNTQKYNNIEFKLENNKEGLVDLTLQIL